MICSRAITVSFPWQVFYFIAFRWNAVTGDDDGVSGWHRIPIHFSHYAVDVLGNGLAFYYFVLACFAVSVEIMAGLLRSLFGRCSVARCLSFVKTKSVRDSLACLSSSISAPSVFLPAWQLTRDGTE